MGSDRAAATDRPAFSLAESQLLCALIAAEPALSRFTFVEFASDAAEIQRLEAFRSAMIWKDVPNRIKCDGKSVRLRPKGFGNFLDQLGVTPEGDRAAFSGGYQYAPLLGGGGECFFSRDQASWKLEGCLHTWDS